MSINIDRKSGVPLYVQIKKHITAQITNNIWHKGYKLPTERELAQMIGVSRNTVSMAYKELEDENLLISQQGKGTFVAGENLNEERVQLETLFENAIDEAVQQGLSLTDIVSLVEKQAEEKIELLSKVHILFIECNHEQVDFFASELSMESGIYVKPYILSSIEQNTQAFIDELKEIDLVVTTFFHYDEVKQLVNSYKKEVIAISLEPQLETMIRIAQLNKSEKCGLVCISNTFAEKVTTALRKAGIKTNNFSYTTTRDPKELASFITSCDFMLTSPGRKKEVLELTNDKTEVIEFVYRPDVGSVNMLKKAVLNFQSRNGKERRK